MLHKNRVDQDTIQRLELATGEGKPAAGIACAICFVALFILSFGFVIQPASLPPLDELYAVSDPAAEVQMVSVTPENAYLLDNADGTYALYIDEEFFMSITKEEITYEPYTSLEIKTRN